MTRPCNVRRSDRVATGVPIFKSWHDSKNSVASGESNPGSPAPDVDAFTTRAARRFSVMIGTLPCVLGSCERHSELTEVVLLVGCLTSQQHASVSQGRICSDNFTCCHTEIEVVADPTFYLTQSQYTDTGPTSPSADPITPGAWQGSHWDANFEVTGMTRPRKNPGASGIRPRDLPLSRRTP